MKKEKRYNKDIKEIVRQCANCGNEDKGNYCSNCGQSFTSLDRPMRDIFHEFLDLLNFDSRLTRTVIPFVLKPGFLTDEYLKGKRKQYMSPMRLYIFFSVIFFFLAQSASKNLIGRSDNIRFHVGSDSTQSIITSDSALIEILTSDSLYYGMASAIDSLDSTQLERSEKIRQSALKATNNQDIFLADFYKYLSYILFVLMPIFALLLFLLHFKKRRYYVEHLLFSINMHSFTLMIASFLVIIRLIFKIESDLPNLILFLIPVYFVSGMMRYYKQRFLLSLLKGILLFILYGIFLVASFMVSGLLAFLLI